MLLQRKDFTLVRGVGFDPVGDATAKFGLKVIIDVQHRAAGVSERMAPPEERRIAALRSGIGPNIPGWVS